MERLAIWIWPFAMALAWLAALFAAVGMAAWTQFGLSVGDARWDLAIVLAVAGLLGAGATYVIGRWLFGGSLRPVRQPSLLGVAIGIGIAIAIAVELTLHAWAETQIGIYDPEHHGVTGWLSIVLLLVTTTTFGGSIAPPAARIGSLLALAGAAALVGVIVLANAPGLRDGIEPESWPLAVLIGLAGVYAVGAVVIGARRIVRA